LLLSVRGRRILRRRILRSLRVTAQPENRDHGSGNAQSAKLAHHT